MLFPLFCRLLARSISAASISKRYWSLETHIILCMSSAIVDDFEWATDPLTFRFSCTPRALSKSCSSWIRPNGFVRFEECLDTEAFGGDGTRLKNVSAVLRWRIFKAKRTSFASSVSLLFFLSSPCLRHCPSEKMERLLRNEHEHDEWCYDVMMLCM